MQKDYFNYCLNRLDVLRTSGTQASWIWIGKEKQEPYGRLKEWIEVLLRYDTYFPTVEEIVKYTPDEGTALERFDAGVNGAYTAEFARKFGIAVQGVVFTLTMNETVTLKAENHD